MIFYILLIKTNFNLNHERCKVNDHNIYYENIIEIYFMEHNEYIMSIVISKMYKTHIVLLFGHHYKIDIHIYLYIKIYTRITAHC